MSISQKTSNANIATKQSGKSSTQATIEELRRSAEVFLRAFQSSRQLQTLSAANAPRQSGISGKKTPRTTKAGLLEPREEIARKIISELQGYIKALRQSATKPGIKSTSKMTATQRNKLGAASASATSSKSATPNGKNAMSGSARSQCGSTAKSAMRTTARSSTSRSATSTASARSQGSNGMSSTAKLAGSGSKLSTKAASQTKGVIAARKTTATKTVRAKAAVLVRK